MQINNIIPIISFLIILCTYCSEAPKILANIQNYTTSQFQYDSLAVNAVHRQTTDTNTAHVFDSVVNLNQSSYSMGYDIPFLMQETAIKLNSLSV